MADREAAHRDGYTTIHPGADPLARAARKATDEYTTDHRSPNRGRVMEREHVADLIAALEQHLRELFLTRAKLGTYTPPHINTEIERIQGELTRLQSSAQSFDGMTMGRVLMAECMRLDTAIRDVRREVRELREHLDQRFDSLLTALAARVSPEPKPITRRMANGGK